MARAAVGDLATQYREAFRILYDEIGRFDRQQWLAGLSGFLVPVKVAMHIFDCLDYYFAEGPIAEYRWGHRFGGGWWELPADRLPDAEAVAAYARELEARILVRLSALDDADLSRPFAGEEQYTTLLGHWVYALRHTMHHHGELAALNVYSGNEGGAWD